MQTQDLVDALCAQRNAAQNEHANSAAQVSDLRRQLSSALDDIAERDKEIATLKAQLAGAPQPEPAAALVEREPHNEGQS